MPEDKKGGKEIAEQVHEILGISKRDEIAYKQSLPEQVKIDYLTGGHTPEELAEILRKCYPELQSSKKESIDPWKEQKKIGTREVSMELHGSYKRQIKELVNSLGIGGIVDSSNEAFTYTAHKLHEQLINEKRFLMLSRDEGVKKDLLLEVYRRIKEIKDPKILDDPNYLLRISQDILNEQGLSLKEKILKIEEKKAAKHLSPRDEKESLLRARFFELKIDKKFSGVILSNPEWTTLVYEVVSKRSDSEDPMKIIKDIRQRLGDYESAVEKILQSKGLDLEQIKTFLVAQNHLTKEEADKRITKKNLSTLLAKYEMELANTLPPDLSFLDMADKKNLSEKRRNQMIRDAKISYRSAALSKVLRDIEQEGPPKPSPSGEIATVFKKLEESPTGELEKPQKIVVEELPEIEKEKIIKEGGLDSGEYKNLLARIKQAGKERDDLTKTSGLLEKIDVRDPQKVNEGLMAYQKKLEEKLKYILDTVGEFKGLVEDEKGVRGLVKGIKKQMDELGQVSNLAAALLNEVITSEPGLEEKVKENPVAVLNENLLGKYIRKLIFESLPQTGYSQPTQPTYRPNIEAIADKLFGGKK